jgi:hypothetical protein
MRHIVGNAARAHQATADKPVRYTRISVRDSSAAAMLQGCPVVTANGEKIGNVEQLIIDVRTHQLRYVMLSNGEHDSAEIALPWKTLYFDSAMARLVFYTWP